MRPRILLAITLLLSASAFAQAPPPQAPPQAAPEAPPPQAAPQGEAPPPSAGPVPEGTPPIVPWTTLVPTVVVAQGGRPAGGRRDAGTTPPQSCWFYEGGVFGLHHGAVPYFSRGAEVTRLPQGPGSTQQGAALDARSSPYFTRGAEVTTVGAVPYFTRGAEVTTVGDAAHFTRGAEINNVRDRPSWTQGATMLEVSGAPFFREGARQTTHGPTTPVVLSSGTLPWPAMLLAQMTVAPPCAP